MKSIVKSQQDYEYNYIIRRTGSLILDYLIWYLIYAFMVVVFFFENYGLPIVSGDLLYYKDTFNTIIKTPIFSFTYLGIICFLEIVIPLITNGQSLTKKVFKIRIAAENNSIISLIIRSLVRIIILNPYGVIAYLIGNSINSDYINNISDILSIVFIISVVFVFKHKKSLHDKITNTNVELV